MATLEPVCKTDTTVHTFTSTGFTSVKSEELDLQKSLWTEPQPSVVDCTEEKTINMNPYMVQRW